MTKAFLIDATERAAKTFAQALLAVFTIQGMTVLDGDWSYALATAGTAAFVSVLTSVVSLPIGNRGTASMTTVVEPSGRHAAPDQKG